MTYAYDALGRKVTREETLWAENQPQGKAWGLQKEPGEKAAPATEGKESGDKPDTGKGRKSAATTEVAAAVEEEPVTCPEGTVPVEVHGNAEKGEKGNSKAAKPLKKETQTTRYLYDGLTSVVANEYGQNGQDVAQYYRSQRAMIARKQFGLKGLVTPGQEETLPMAGGLKYYHPDLRGSVSALTTPKGEIAEQYRYDAFGGLFTGITAPYNTLGLNGHEFDPASGLVDMKARWYAPQNGRFMTPDTWRGTLEEPWTQNKYAYAGNNPVTRWDPTGNFSCDLGQDCTEFYEDGLIDYYFQSTRDGGSSYTPGDSWTDLAGTHQSYSGYRTTLYDYFAIVWIFDPPSVSFWFVEFAEDEPHSYTTTDPHTQESLNEYTEGYREGRTGPMPAERNVSAETMATSPGTGEKVKPVRRPVAGDSSGAQVLTQVVAYAIGDRYEVLAGDSLSAIAQRVYNDGSKWPAILAANPQLQNPNVIFPGQVLNLPGAPMGPDRADYSQVQAGERLDATTNLDATAYPGGAPAVGGSMAQDPTGDCISGFDWFCSTVGKPLQSAWDSMNRTVYSSFGMAPWFLISGAFAYAEQENWKDQIDPLRGVGGFKVGVSADEIRAINRAVGGRHEWNSVAEVAVASAERYDGFWRKTAAVVRSIAHGHMFNDGNKRTAMEVVELLMQRNKIASGVPREKMEQIILDVAEGNLTDIDEIAKLLGGF